MITIDRSTERQARLSRALETRIKKPAPRAVVTWAQEHLRLPESDLRRMKKLYDKVMEETITADETAELDNLMESSSAMDLLRARLLLGPAAGRKLRRQ